MKVLSGRCTASSALSILFVAASGTVHVEGFHKSRLVHHGAGVVRNNPLFPKEIVVESVVKIYPSRRNYESNLPGKLKTGSSSPHSAVATDISSLPGDAPTKKLQHHILKAAAIRVINTFRYFFIAIIGSILNILLHLLNVVCDVACRVTGGGQQCCRWAQRVRFWADSRGKTLPPGRPVNNMGLAREEDDDTIESLQSLQAMAEENTKTQAMDDTDLDENVILVSVNSGELVGEELAEAKKLARLKLEEIARLEAKQQQRTQLRTQHRTESDTQPRQVAVRRSPLQHARVSQEKSSRVAAAGNRGAAILNSSLLTLGVDSTLTDNGDAARQTGESFSSNTTPSKEVFANKNSRAGTGSGSGNGDGTGDSRSSTRSSLQQSIATAAAPAAPFTSSPVPATASSASLMDQVKSKGSSGVVAYVITELLFWALFPLLIYTYQTAALHEVPNLADSESRVSMG